LLVLAGLYYLIRSLGRHVLPALPPQLASFWNGLWNVTRAMALPAVLIAIGLLLIFGISRRENGGKLVRSRSDRIIAGVCGGLGRYFKIDPTWVRLAWVLLTVFSAGVGGILYLVAMLAIPEEVPES
jgi:phage shock protein PspC (stress-responsive transcriptional regulator)